MRMPAATLRNRTTGHARYAADLVPEDAVIAGMARSPHAHARVTNIDASEALKIPGVLAVLTPADFGDLRLRHRTRGSAGADIGCALCWRRRRCRCCKRCTVSRTRHCGTEYRLRVIASCTGGGRRVGSRNANSRRLPRQHCHDLFCRARRLGCGETRRLRYGSRAHSRPKQCRTLTSNHEPRSYTTGTVAWNS